MNTDTLIDAINAGDAQIAEVIGPYSFTRAELSMLFSRVQDMRNWKLPVDTHTTFSDTRERIGMHVAVRFFTGSVATLELISSQGPVDTYRVRAAGYYAAIGA